MERRNFIALVSSGLAGGPFRPGDALGQATRASKPDGQLSWGVHVSLAPTWFDPAETAGSVIPYMLLYALHDAAVKAMPGQPMAASLAESWSMSNDGLSYHFTLRQDAKFHSGDLVTTEDVKFSFERYRGTSAKILHDRVKLVEIVDPQRLRFVLKQPWADFMTFYATATGAAWVVPKKYVEKVGEDGFKKAPIGAGPYKFVTFVPGVELVLEAFDQYWRKPPTVKRLVFKVMPDESSRLAALRRGEVDVVYQVRGALAEELQRTPGLTLKPTAVHATLWIYFPEQWDPQSAWHDQRVRLAVNHAINWRAINQAENLGHCKLTGSIVPSTFDLYWQPPPYAYDPAKARQLLSAAGHQSGFDAGDYVCDVSFASLAEAIVNDLRVVGIRTKIRSLERAAFWALYSDKKARGLIQGGSGTAGNAATRLEAFAVAGGAYAYGSHADIDALFREQAVERERESRERLLHRIQQLVHERAMFAPIWEHVLLNGVGPRVEEAGLGQVAGHPFSAPYEDLRVKGR